MKLLIILLLSPVLAFSQSQIQGVVVNSRGAPLPYTNVVSLKKRIGTVTNENGEFEINNIEIADSIKISNIAFIPRWLAVKDLSPGEKIILADSLKKLRDIVVRNFSEFKYVHTLGFLSYPKNGEFKLLPGSQLATFISNPSNREGWVKGVYFKIKKFGKCKNSLRIRLLRTDTIDFKPGADILNENVTLSSDVLKKTNYIDLSDHKIVLPKKGLFVVIEWLYPVKNCDKNSYSSIAANLDIETNLVWLNFRDKNWDHANTPRLPNGNFMTPDMGIKVAY